MVKGQAGYQIENILTSPLNDWHIRNEICIEEIEFNTRPCSTISGGK